MSDATQQNGMPLMPMTSGNTRGNKTGSWRFLRPIYRDATAACREGCPNANDVQSAMRLLADGDLDGAWQALVWDNPFPAITGRVCHHPCEDVCNRAKFDDALGIHSVERFLGDHALREAKRVPKLCEHQSTSVAVIGAGPAGLACAYHLARLGHGVTIYEADEEPGGVLRYGIPNYRLPKDILEGEIERVLDLGVRLVTGTRLGEDRPWEELADFDATFIATGLGRSRQLDVSGEDLQGVHDGLEFLRTLNTGGTIDVGDRVAVIGGGNTAMDVARSARRLGAEVDVFYRRSRDEMPAIADEIDEALEEDVEIHTLLSPVAIHGDDRVASIELVRMRLGEPDDSGRRRPIPIEGEAITREVDSVITAIGEGPDFSFMPETLQTTRNVITVDDIGRTRDPNVWAGGDVVEQPHTVVDALASGKRAAMAIDRTFDDADPSAIREEVRLGRADGLSMRRYVQGDSAGVDPERVVEYDDVNPHYFPHKQRTPTTKRNGYHDLAGDFEEVELGFIDSFAQREANRCFNCGTCTECDNCFVFCPDLAVLRTGDPERPYRIDTGYCKGCGICAHECPRGAIELQLEEKAVSQA
ncbi:MAG: NAD(P)-binding protein [Candidatus Bipolaricaulia bacterium]